MEKRGVSFKKHPIPGQLPTEAVRGWGRACGRPDECRKVIKDTHKIQSFVCFF
jgi:hypothetical protein